MTIEEIRKGAPKGSTHYYRFKNGNVIYFKYFLETDSLYRMTPDWCATSYSIDRLKPL